MFNNPLKKYQTGGTTPSQNDIQQLIQGIAKVVNQTPEYVAKQMQQIMQTQDGETMLTEAIQEYSNNPESGLTKLKQLFPGEGAQMAKLGGKIRDFICKHAKGGYVAGCGCGGNIVKAQNSVPGGMPNPYANYEMLRDTSYTNSNGNRIYEAFLKNKLGEALKYSTQNGKNEIGLTGYISDDGKFINEGDGTVNIEALKQRLAEINKTKSEAKGGIVKAQLGSSGFPTYNNNTNALNEYINGVPNSGSLFSGPAVKIYIDGLDRNLVQAQEDGGIVKAQDGSAGFNKAVGYYKRRANADSIRKIQTFLAGHGYNVGDIDGKFGKNTYAAIQQYQRDNKLKDDGMWGEDTNQVHRVLTSENSTFNGSRSGAHFGNHTFSSGFNQRYDNGVTPTLSDIGKVYEYAVSNPEWFFGDTDDAKRWRVYFENMKNGNGQQMIKDIWRETPDEIRSKINYKKLPTSLAQHVYEQGIRDYRDNEGVGFVTHSLAVPLAIMNPVGFVGSVAGGAIGAEQGWRAGSDINYKVETENGLDYQNMHTGVYKDPTGEQVPLVRPDKSTEGEAIGTAIGTVLGGLGADYISNNIGNWGWQGRPGAPSQYNWNGTNNNGSTTIFEKSPGTGSSKVNINSANRGVARTTVSDSGHYGAGRTRVNGKATRTRATRLGRKMRKEGGIVKPNWTNRIKK